MQKGQEIYCNVNDVTIETNSSSLHYQSCCQYVCASASVTINPVTLLSLGDVIK